MHVPLGRLPVSGALVALSLCAAAPLAAADSRAPLTLVEAEDIALASEPGYSALRESAAALRDRSHAAAELPDPALRVGMANFPVNRGGFTTEGMTQAQIGLRQEFPRGDTRELSAERFLARSRAQEFAAEGRHRETLMAVRVAWLDVYYWTRAAAILDESRPLFADLVEITESLYSVGRKSQHDLLRAELELSRLDDRLIEASRAKQGAQARLSQWIGAAAYRATAPHLPGWDAIPALSALRSALDAHPRLLAADAEIEARQSVIAIAEEAVKPGWVLDFGYGFRDGVLPSGEPRSDFVSLSVTVDLPMFGRQRRRSALSAALHERSAARSGRQRLLARLEADLAGEHARWSEHTRRLALYDRSVLQLSEGQAEAAMLAYQSDAGSFSDVLLGYIGSLNTRIDYVRIQTERAKAYAALAALGGVPR